MDFWGVNRPFLVSASIIALGYLFKKIRVVGEKEGGLLARLAINFTLPAVLLLTIPDIRWSPEFALLPVLNAAVAGLFCIAAWGAFRKFTRRVRGMGVMMSPGINIGLFALPLVQGLYGDPGVTHFAMVNMANPFLIFGLSAWLGHRFSNERNRRPLGFVGTVKLFLTSVPFMVFLFAVLLNVTGISLPGFVREIVAVPAVMNRGLALFALGVLLKFRIPAEARRFVARFLAVRYAVGLVAGMSLFFALPFDTLFRTVVAVAFILPVPMTVIPHSLRWGYDESVAATTLNVGIVVSFVLFWGIALFAGTSG